MLKVFARAMLGLASISIIGCGSVPQDGSHLTMGGISSGGLPFRCEIENGDLSGRSYAGHGLVIEFFNANKAAFRLVNDDIKYLVNYQADSDCFVTLSDDVAPTLRNGRQFVMFHDLSYMTDWNDRRIVLQATAVR